MMAGLLHRESVEPNRGVIGEIDPNDEGASFGLEPHVPMKKVAGGNENVVREELGEAYYGSQRYCAAHGAAAPHP